jgi:hypothetical protein
MAMLTTPEEELTHQNSLDHGIVHGAGADVRSPCFFSFDSI